MKIIDLFNDSCICRTRAIDQDIFECKVKKTKSEYCSFSIASGRGFLCKHPDRINFARSKS